MFCKPFQKQQKLLIGFVEFFFPVAPKYTQADSLLSEFLLAMV